eukprot:8111325-Pyramimonas_sp.AAC.1
MGGVGVHASLASKLSARGTADTSPHWTRVGRAVSPDRWHESSIDPCRQGLLAGPPTRAGPAHGTADTNAARIRVGRA